MPSFRQTSPTVSPLARSRSASRSTRATSSALRRLRMGPSVDWVYRGTNITAGPGFGEQATPSLPVALERLVGRAGVDPPVTRWHPTKDVRATDGGPHAKTSICRPTTPHISAGSPSVVARSRRQLVAVRDAELGELL